MCSDNKQTRRKKAARLLLFLCGICCVGIFLFQGADALRNHVSTATVIPHQEQPVNRVRSATDTAGKTDINLATAEDLRRADGIGSALAQRIIEKREERGGFRFLEELMDVPGIGEKRYEALRALFYCPTHGP